MRINSEQSTEQDRLKEKSIYEACAPSITPAGTAGNNFLCLPSALQKTLTGNKHTFLLSHKRCNFNIKRMKSTEGTYKF